MLETKKPELVQDQAQVVTGAAEQHIHLVALCAFQEVAAQPPVGFQVADNRFNRLAALERAFQSLCLNAAFLPGDVHGGPRFLVAPVVLVHKRLINRRPGETPHLFQGLLQGMPVIGVARHGHAAHHKVAPVGRGNAGLHPELIAFMHLPLC